MYLPDVIHTRKREVGGTAALACGVLAALDDAANPPGPMYLVVVVIYPSTYLDLVFASRTGISTRARVASLTLTRP
jgi:hypothetical protein